MTGTRSGAALGQRLVVLGCLITAPFVSVSDSFDCFLLPKWAVIKIAALLILLFFVLEERERRPQLLATPIDLCAVLLLGATTVASFWTPGLWTALERPVELLSLWVIFRAAASNLSEEPRKLVVASVIPASVLSLVAIGHRAFSGSALSAGLAAAFTGHPNYAGQWGVLVLPVSAGLLLASRSRLATILSAASFALISFYVLLSGCRGAWLALLGGVLVVAAFGGGIRVLRLLPKRKLIIIATALAALAVALWLTGELEERVTSLVHGTSSGVAFRMHTWNSTLKMISKEPLLGVGAGGFVGHYQRYRSAEELSLFRPGRFVENPHNSFLLAAAEAGPLGLIALLMLAGTVLRLAFQAAGNPKGRDAAIRIGLAVALVGTLIHAVISFNLESPLPALYFWAMAGVLARPCKESAKREQPVELSRWKEIAYRGVALSVAFFLALAVAADTRRLTASTCAFVSFHQQRLGDLSKAENLLRMAIRLSPESPTYRYFLAQMMMKKGEYDSCERLNRESLAYWPYFRDALLDLGIALLHQGRLDEAREYMVKSLEVDPTNVNAHITLGNLFASLNHYPEALRQYELAAGYDEFGSESYYYIAAMRFREGAIDEALAAVEKALSDSLRFLDRDLSITFAADMLAHFLDAGKHRFQVVIRDSEGWSIWEGEMSGAVTFSTSPPAITSLTCPNGVAIHVGPEGRSLAIRFEPVRGAYAYSLVVPKETGPCSFDFLACAEHHSRTFALYGSILDALGRHDEARQAWLQSLKLNPDNAQAKMCLDSVELDDHAD